MQQNTPHIPDDLQQAINQIYLWVKDGCPEQDHFYSKVGLCSVIAFVTNRSPGEVNEYFFEGNEYPFNSDWLEYNNEVNKYTNPKRLAWLQEHQTVE